MNEKTDGNRVDRRGFLRGAGAIGGGSVLALAFAGMPASLKTALASGPSDIDILNYALTLEHLEATFYIDGLKKFDDNDFKHARLLRNLGSHTRNTSREYFRQIRKHEITHVDTLTSVIKQLGGKPVGACDYKFGYTNVDEFIGIAQALENTGVMAYDGAIALIKSPELQTAGATIATVEARHASYLNFLKGEIPFPMAFDEPKTMKEILAIAGQFIVSC